MKAMAMAMAVVCLLFGVCASAQDSVAKPQPHKALQTDPQTTNPQTKDMARQADSDDLVQLNADLDRLKVLLNQMRTNLAFVQSSQTPLKHQFELEADAWQVIVEQMERRLRRMEGRGSREPVR